ncbi:cell division protein FtsQ/DivIB [Acetobacter farinalis]|uniref:Cell division protein FtsQ n=1 Tax=Acetobacter farinalis TaxID=1260984 RepID=A0ABT3Q6S2_9PROT|nr:cell division protein FtsQ/DivIB [Acetobacter farinalis]MCX2560992.1 cell division protein FtsQ/DivIB [Acetobacter farinalis]NHO29758.1 FtsQ-type POTRA domain-containing protein [Acetobacter farinalis]
MRIPSSPSDRPSRFGLFARRQKRLIRPLSGLLFLAALGGGGYLYLQQPGAQERLAPLRDKVLSATPLRITQIQVDGAQLTSEAAIHKALGVSVGDPVLNFSVSEARDRLNALPFVDHVTVERHLSGDIKVTITERPPFAVWQHQGHFELIDRQGKRVPDQGMTGKDAEAFTKLPLVVGDGANEAASALIDALTKEPAVRSHVIAAVRVSNRRWDLTLRDGATVLLPEGEETPALHRLSQFDTSMHLLDRPVVLIDMRLPDRLTIREKPPQPPAPPAETDTDAAAPGSHPAQPHSPQPGGSSPAARQGSPA